MPLAGIGLVLLILKILEIGPVADWGWTWVLAPFGAAVVWWLYADMSGLTQRQAMRKMEERKIARRERDMEALGLNVQSDRSKRAAQRAADKAKSDLQAKKDAGGR